MTNIFQKFNEDFLLADNAIKNYVKITSGLISHSHVNDGLAEAIGKKLGSKNVTISFSYMDGLDEQCPASMYITVDNHAFYFTVDKLNTEDVLISYRGSFVPGNQLQFMVSVGKSQSSLDLKKDMVAEFISDDIDAILCHIKRSAS